MSILRAANKTPVRIISQNTRLNLPLAIVSIFRDILSAMVRTVGVPCGPPAPLGMGMSCGSSCPGPLL